MAAAFSSGISGAASGCVGLEEGAGLKLCGPQTGWVPPESKLRGA